MAATRTTPDEGLGTLQRPLADLCCVNSECSDAGHAGRGNLSVRTGKGRGRWRILYCSTCKSEFSERKGTALFGAMMAPERIVAVAEHLEEGCGIRKTARLTGASKDGVTRIAKRLGLHSKALHDVRVRDLEVREAQLDEKWACNRSRGINAWKSWPFLEPRRAVIASISLRSSGRVAVRGTGSS